MTKFPDIRIAHVPETLEQLNSNLFSIWDAYEYLVDNEVLPIFKKVFKSEDLRSSITRISPYIGLRLKIEYTLHRSWNFGDIKISYILKDNQSTVIIPDNEVYVDWTSHYQKEMGSRLGHDFNHVRANYPTWEEFIKDLPKLAKRIMRRHLYFKKVYEATDKKIMNFLYKGKL